MKNSELKKMKVLFKNYLKIKDKRGCLKKDYSSARSFQKLLLRSGSGKLVCNN